MNFTESAIKIVDMLHDLIVNYNVERLAFKWDIVIWLLDSFDDATKESRINGTRTVSSLIENVASRYIDTVLHASFNDFPHTAAIVQNTETVFVSAIKNPLRTKLVIIH